jgi:DNA topoisomerase-3
MSAKEVLDTCQALYEKHELQTYPRTDCQYLPENQFSDAATILDHVKNSHPHLVQAVAGANPNLKGPSWDDSKLGEHFGLIPTKKEADLSQLSPNEKRIYQAVCERYVAQFYPACEYKTAAIIVECEKETFKANGKIILKAGWRAIFNNEEEAEDKTNDDEQEQVFPNISAGQQVVCKNSKKTDKKTAAPPRFTEGTLIKAMTSVHTLVSDPEQKKKLKEKKGIGQEATRTQIIENLFKRTLFTKQGKQIISSPAARSLIHALPKKVTDPALTAVWEDALDKIAEGKITSQTFKEKQTQWILQLVAEAQKTTIGAIVNVAPAGKTSAGGKISVGAGGSAKPAAKSASGGAKKGKTCPKCGKGQMVERTAKASGKKFMACNNYPECNHVEWPKTK